MSYYDDEQRYGQGTPSGYKPEYDSAFLQNPYDSLKNAQPAEQQGSYQQPQQGYQQPQRPQQGPVEPPVRHLEQYKRRQQPEPLQPRGVSVPHVRSYDPDQMVSDDDFENTYDEYGEEDYSPEYEDYDESYEEADNREVRQEKGRKKREKQEAKWREEVRQEEEYKEKYKEKYREKYREEFRKEEKEKLKQAKKQKKKKSFARRFFRNLLIIILILFLIFGLAVWNVTKRFNHIDTAVSQRSDSMKHTVVNILLIGQDAREGESGQRSDSMILVSVNQKKNTVALTSIMRDTYVDIPGYGGNRINAAYAYGGMDLLDQTIEENFGITIDGNAMVDFEGFLEAMTAIGELDIELSAEEAQYMNENPALGSNNDVSDEEWNLTEGVNTLTPSQVLCYSRMRYVGNSDWDRTERQRTVISAAVSKIKHGHLLSGYNLATKAAPSITTDMKTFGMLRLAAGIITSGDMNSYIIPVEGTYYGDNINGMSVLVPDIQQNRDYLQKYINGEVEETTEEE